LNRVAPMRTIAPTAQGNRSVLTLGFHPDPGKPGQGEYRALWRASGRDQLQMSNNQQQISSRTAFGREQMILSLYSNTGKISSSTLEAVLILMNRQ